MSEISESAYYDRQVRLPEVGVAGQAKLKQARVLVVGAGGLGCPALSYLAAAGVGTLGICEGDDVELSNLHRQTIYGHASVGESKAECAAERLRDHNPFIEVRTHTERLTPDTAEQLFRDYDFVLDCTDNFATKYLINDTAVVTRTPVIFASIYQYDGQLFVVDSDAGTACMRCLWPEIPDPGCVGSCAEVGVLGAVPGIFGSFQAIEAIKRILGLPGCLDSSMILFDCLSFTTQRVPFPKYAGCALCGDAPTITSIDAAAYDPTCSWECELESINLSDYQLIDIREADEVQANPIASFSHTHIAMSTWNLDAPSINSEASYLLSCARGARSRALVEQLRARGHDNVYSLIGGAEALNEEAHENNG